MRALPGDAGSLLRSSKPSDGRLQQMHVGREFTVHSTGDCACRSWGSDAWALPGSYCESGKKTNGEKKEEGRI